MKKEVSATEIVDLRRRLDSVENELKLERAPVSLILIVTYSIYRNI